MLNELAGEIHANAIEKGFWPEGGRPDSEVLLLIISEVIEAMDDLRRGFGNNEVLYQSPDGAWCTTENHNGQFLKPVGVPSEIADVIIRALDAAAAWDIDIESAVREKMEYNSTRKFMHGKQF